MATNRITRSATVRRALLLGVGVALLLTVATACGGGGNSDAGDREGDVKVLNELLARQSAAVAAYAQVLPELAGEDRAAAEQFRAQEQEHVDATTKTLRGLEGESDPPPETIDAEDVNNRSDSLEFLYEMESATIDFELNAVSRMTVGWPRPLIAAMAANQAQRLVLLRRALGAAPLEAIPSAFETGEIPAPERTRGR